MQQELQRHLLGENSAIIAAIVDAPPLPAADRLAIYRNAYQVRLIEALDDTYPMLHALLGDEVFVALGEAFVAAHPSVHRSIRWYGRRACGFPGAAARPTRNSPFWRKSRCSNGRWRRCSTQRTPSLIARGAIRRRSQRWSDLRFEFHPSLRRLRSCSGTRWRSGRR